MNVYGLQLPEKVSWIARTNIYFSQTPLLQELCMIIAEYGSPFKLRWPLAKRCTSLEGLDNLKAFNCDKHFPVNGKEHFKVQYTSHIGKIYVDLLSDGKWHQRSHDINQIWPKECGCNSLRCPNLAPKIYMSSSSI